MATYPSVLTLISDFFFLSEVATMWHTDSAAYKLKPRLFYKYHMLSLLVQKIHLYGDITFPTIQAHFTRNMPHSGDAII